MLKLNRFYWDLYKQSPEGENTIKNFNILKDGFNSKVVLDLIKEYDPEYLDLNIEGVKDNFDFIYDDIKIYFEQLRGLNISDTVKAVTSFIQQDEDYCLDNIVPLSFILYCYRPDYFIPYLFLFRYRYLEQVADNLDLDFGEVPGPMDKAKRCIYYLSICSELYKYRMYNNLNSEELCALIYDMERKSYDSEFSQESTAYPRVWWIVGRKTEEESKRKEMFFQANPETKKGDIMIFFERSDTFEKSHRSSITGIWTAKMDGNVDPFFHFYRYTFIGNEIPVVPIPFKIIKSDELTSSIKGISAQFQNYSGREVPADDYDRILKLIKKYNPSFDESLIPQRYSEEIIEGVPYEERGDMKPEKWVEENRIVPLLQKLGWGRADVDYRRQVYLQLGRKKSEDSKVQSGKTDFSVFPFGERRKCADILIEAKGPGEMDGDKKLRDAFDQGESYASRQYAELLVLADDKQLLFYTRCKEGNFRFTNTPYARFEWKSIFEENSEDLLKVYNIFTKFQKHKPKK